MASFGPLAFSAQPTQTHPEYPNRPLPIPITQILRSGEASLSTSVSPIAGTTLGGGRTIGV